MKKLLSYLRDYKKECVLAPLFKLMEASFELIVPLVMAAIISSLIQMVENLVARLFLKRNLWLFHQMRLRDLVQTQIAKIVNTLICVMVGVDMNDIMHLGMNGSIISLNLRVKQFVYIMRLSKNGQAHQMYLRENACWIPYNGIRITCIITIHKG